MANAGDLGPNVKVRISFDNKTQADFMVPANSVELLEGTRVELPDGTYANIVHAAL